MREPEFYLGKPVRSLQTMLRHISEEDTRILPLIPDGVFGGNTYASVRSFQQTYQLPDTGAVDSSTWNSIVSVHNQLLPTRFPPSIFPVWPPDYRILPGESNDHIFLIQAMLAAISRYFPTQAAPALTGTLDEATENGLRWLQSAGGLTVTGTLDTTTWHYLTGLYRIMTGSG